MSLIDRVLIERPTGLILLMSSLLVLVLVKLLIDKTSRQKAAQDSSDKQYWSTKKTDQHLSLPYLSFCVSLELNLDFFRGELLLLKNASLNRLDVSSPKLSRATVSMTGFLRAR